MVADKKAERIAKLRRITLASGASPQEVETAAAMVRRLTSTVGKYAGYEAWLRGKTDYPYWAKPVLTVVHPSTVPGSVSACLRKGQRTYAFRTTAERDAFNKGNALYVVNDDGTLNFSNPDGMAAWFATKMSEKSTEEPDEEDRIP